MSATALSDRRIAELRHLVASLRDLSACRNSDFSLGDEAADAIEELLAELEAAS